MSRRLLGTEGDGGRSLHVAGSSFTRWEGALADEAGWRGLWESEDQQILKVLPELSPDFAGSRAAADPGWASLRAMKLDRLPVAGGRRPTVTAGQGKCISNLSGRVLHAESRTENYVERFCVL